MNLCIQTEPETFKGDQPVMSRTCYNFILPDSREYALPELEASTPEGVLGMCKEGEFIWAFISYYHVKTIGLPAKLSFDLDSGAINLAHGNVLRSLKMRPGCFCVSLQADFPHFPLAQYHIVQNQEQVSNNASFVPHWPLPGQQPRDRSRTGVAKVAYQGARKFTDLDEQRLNADLKKHGITFEIMDEQSWPYLQEVDVLVGIRSFGTKKYKRKPPTKLIDAWHAEIPFIGGWDSAYSQIGDPDRNYLRVSTYDALLESIIRLKQNPALYAGLVAAGRLRASDYTFEAIAEVWRNLLEGKVAERFLQWKLRPAKNLMFALRKTGVMLNSFIRFGLRQLYVIPGIRRIRDRYYDPVK